MDDVDVDSAAALFDSCRTAGWVSLAVHYASGWSDHFGDAYGYDSTLSPYLHMVYRSSGILETRSVLTAQPSLTFAPNPVRSAFVMTNCDRKTRTNLTLCDVLGRTIRSFSLNPSGRTQLDLRDLAPGVYMATLEGTGRPVSRKLIITTR